MHKRIFHILIFSFSVLMLLVRPFMVYQLCAAGDLNKDPQKVNTLLQRLIKKKDDHHVGETAQTAVLAPQQSKRLSAVFLIVVLKRLFHTRAYLSGLPAWGLKEKPVTARPDNLICKFQI